MEGHDSINSFSESMKNSTEKINIGNVLNGAKRIDLVNPNENAKNELAQLSVDNKHN